MVDLANLPAVAEQVLKERIRRKDRQVVIESPFTGY